MFSFTLFSYVEPGTQRVAEITRKQRERIRSTERERKRRTESETAREGEREWEVER